MIYSALLFNIHKVKYNYSTKGECINAINFCGLSEIDLLFKIDGFTSRETERVNSCNCLLEN